MTRHASVKAANEKARAAISNPNVARPAGDHIGDRGRRRALHSIGVAAQESRAGGGGAGFSITF
jgi:hypothetical protein